VAPSSIQPFGHNRHEPKIGGEDGWIKVPLGTEVVLGPSHIVLDGDLAPPYKGAQPPLFGPFIVAKRLDGSRCHLVRM